jgi:hypothetical protein
METEKTLNSKSNPERNIDAEYITIPHFKSHYRVMVTETAWFLPMAQKQTRKPME